MRIGHVLYHHHGNTMVNQSALMIDTTSLHITVVVRSETCGGLSSALTGATIQYRQPIALPLCYF